MIEVIIDDDAVKFRVGDDRIERKSSRRIKFIESDPKVCRQRDGYENECDEAQNSGDTGNKSCHCLDAKVTDSRFERTERTQESGGRGRGGEGERERGSNKEQG